MSFSIFKFTWKDEPGESLAFTKEVRSASKGLAMSVETKLLAGEEIVFIPDTNASFGAWSGFRAAVGFLGPAPGP